jgi:hypothetical protein
MSHRFLTRVALFVWGTLLSIAEIVGQEPEKKPAANPPTPSILFTNPLAIAPGFKGKVILRGLNLDQVNEVSAQPDSIKVKLKKAEKSNPSDDFKAEQVGNSRVEVEVQLATDIKDERISLTLKSKEQTISHELQLLSTDQLVNEVEPNPGFRQSQSIKLGQTVPGTISAAKDVDVYQLELTAAHSIRIETMAARHGSPIDTHLTLYDERGRILAVSDDAAKSRDSLIEHTPLATGKYFISVLDARDYGHADGVYLLKTSAVKP